MLPPNIRITLPLLVKFGKILEIISLKISFITCMI